MKNRIFNDYKPGEYYWQTANIVDDLGLSVYAFRLYAHLVRVSSIRNAGVSTRELASACKMSSGAVSKAKSELVSVGLISFIERPSGKGKPYHEIRICNIAKRNVEHCENKRNSSSGELSDKGVSSPHELVSSPHELVSSCGEHLTRTQEPITLGADAPRAEFSPASVARPEPEQVKKIDVLAHTFERATKPQTIEAVVRAWKAPEHLADLCVMFAEVFGVAVTKADKGKWLGGAARLYELHVTRDTLQRVKRMAGQMTLTHPGAVYELAKKATPASQKPASEKRMVTMTYDPSVFHQTQAEARP